MCVCESVCKSHKLLQVKDEVFLNKKEKKNLWKRKLKTKIVVKSRCCLWWWMKWLDEKREYDNDNDERARERERWDREKRNKANKKRKYIDMFIY